MRDAADRGLNDPAATWSGTLVVGPMVALFNGTASGTSPHRNPAHTIVVDRRGVALIEAGRSHVVAAHGAVTLVMLDGRRFAPREAQRLADRWHTVRPTDALDGLLEDLTRVSVRRVERRVLRGIGSFAAGAPIAEAARRVDLSPSRLTHLVTESLGASPREWRSWLRLRGAVDHVAAGGTATLAAHAAGFSDAAHFARVCRATLGIPPSTFRHTRFRLLEPCHAEWHE
jgi:AraC-like DNA-binding protein